MAQLVVCLPMQEMQETWVRSLSRFPGEGNATYSSILVWRIPWLEESGGLQFMQSQRVGHDWAHMPSFNISSISWRGRQWQSTPWLQSMGSQRVGHDWVTSLSLFTFMHWRRKWQPTPVFLPGESQGQRSLVLLPSMGSPRVGHDWSDLAAAAAISWTYFYVIFSLNLKADTSFSHSFKQSQWHHPRIMCPFLMNILFSPYLLQPSSAVCSYIYVLYAIFYSFFEDKDVPSHTKTSTTVASTLSHGLQVPRLSLTKSTIPGLLLQLTLWATLSHSNSLSLFFFFFWLWWSCALLTLTFSCCLGDSFFLPI